MERTEHKNIVSQLLGMAAAEHQATASELLTQLTEDYESTLTMLETATANEAAVRENNETLRRVNADLFLKVGHTMKTPEPEPTPAPDPEKLTFDALFNEKGDLI